MVDEVQKTQTKIFTNVKCRVKLGREQELNKSSEQFFNKYGQFF